MVAYPNSPVAGRSESTSSLHVCTSSQKFTAVFLFPGYKIHRWVSGGSEEVHSCVLSGQEKLACHPCRLSRRFTIQRPKLVRSCRDVHTSFVLVVSIIPIPTPAVNNFWYFCRNSQICFISLSKKHNRLGAMASSNGHFQRLAVSPPLFPAKCLPCPEHKKPGGLWRDSPKAVRLFCIVSAAGARFRRFPCGSGGCGIPGVRGPRRR